MGGKSTYLRQTALIVILAQMGSFVPATQAKLPIVDRIFTRIGASDNLARGRSTFLVEMSEVAVILNTATSASLVLLDEVGRGTATFDGLSLAWAVVESLQARRAPAHSLRHALSRAHRARAPRPRRAQRPRHSPRSRQRNHFPAARRIRAAPTRATASKSPA